MISNAHTAKKKTPDQLKILSSGKLLTGLLFLVLLAGYSCKTCNCPAYSFRNEDKQKYNNVADPKPDVMKNLPDRETAFLFDD